MDNDLISRQSAIKAIEQMQIPIMRSAFEHNQFIFKGMCEALNAVKELPPAQLDRDIPKKPMEIMDSTWGTDKKQAVCPKCDYYLGYVSFLGDGKGKKVTYCEHCGQAIDWEGWEQDD